MSAFSEYATKQAAFNARQSAAIDSLVSSQAGLAADIQALNDKITALQNSAGEVTPEDQILLDQLESQATALSERSEAVSNALAALDAQTPPAVPAPQQP